MNDYEHWQQSNARQLSDALRRLRGRLEAKVRVVPPAPNPASEMPPASKTKVDAPRPPPVHEVQPVPTINSRSMLTRLLASRPIAVPPVTEAVVEPVLEAEPKPNETPQSSGPEVEVDDNPVEADLEEETPLSALAILGAQLGLSAFEQDILLLCIGMELDTRIAGLCARAQDDERKPYPTFALALSLFDNPVWDAVSPKSPLRLYHLIDVSSSGAVSITASELRADERIVSYVKGMNYLDERLDLLVSRMGANTPAEGDLAPSQQRVVDTILRRINQSDPLVYSVIQLVGPDSASKQLIARALAERLERVAYRLPVELLPSTPGDLELLARLWRRESQLLRLAMYLDFHDADDAPGERLAAMLRFVDRSDGLIFLSAREALAAGSTGYGPSLVFDIGRPTRAEQKTAWSMAIGSGSTAALPGTLAGQFDFNLPALRRLADFAKTEASGAQRKFEDTIWEACCASERPRLDMLAQRITPRLGWDDLVLPSTEKGLLLQITAQVHNRGRVYGEWGLAEKSGRGLAINALFAGPSGTGKTMAAEVIARELHLDLYRIDLSQVVNKYIGQTEKNLRQLFDAAETSGAILFFDEADALFGKRSAVKDSHDRYANIEVNYLLQRMESFGGLAILATNIKSALDEAFLRRLRFVVNFPVPSAADRRRIWEKALPARSEKMATGGLPVGRLDYDRLARLNLTGGHIQSVAMNAAFLAAQEEKPNISMRMVLEAARTEFNKLERPSTAADFVWREPAPSETLLEDALP